MFFFLLGSVKCQINSDPLIRTKWHNIAQTRPFNSCNYFIIFVGLLDYIFIVNV